MNATSNVVRSLIRSIALSIIPPLRATKERIVFLEKLIGEKDQKINLLVQEKESEIPGSDAQLDKKVIQHGHTKMSLPFSFAGFAIKKEADRKHLVVIEKIAAVISRELNLEAGQNHTLLTS